MTYLNLVRAISTFGLLLVVAIAHAGDSAREIADRISLGNPVAGKEKSTMCQGCHGELGISTMDYVPNLAGQWAAYTIRQLRDFGIGSRSNAIMSDMAATVASQEDAFDIAAYFASQNLMAASEPHHNEQGRRLYIVYKCASCHGDEGRGRPLNNALFPIIGGQRKEYLIKQLEDFKTEFRDTDMSGTMPLVSKRMSKAEIESISDYLSGL